MKFAKKFSGHIFRLRYILQVPSLEGSDIEDSKLAICKLEVDEGPCDETLQRWYFDIKSSTCRPFIYGGCAGNRYVYCMWQFPKLD